MEELKKKIAEWVGFEFKRLYSWYEDGAGYTMENVFVKDGEVVADFTTSLDACFKYIVPKLEDLQNIYFTQRRNGEWEARLWFYTGIMQIGYGLNNPALAFCRAVEKLIDG